MESPKYISRTGSDFRVMDPEIVRSSSEKIGEHFHLPRKLIERGIDTTVVQVGDADIIEEIVFDSKHRVAHQLDVVRDYIARRVPVTPYEETLIDVLSQSLADTERLSEFERDEHVRANAKDKANETLGIFFLRHDGSRLALINKRTPEKTVQTVVDHELIHSISFPEFDGTAGFSDFIPIGLITPGLDFDVLNETATELLRVAARYGYTLDDIRRLSLQDRVPTNQPDQIYILSEVFAMTTDTNQPILVQEVADYYFGLNRGNSNRRGRDFIDMLYRRVPVEHHDYVYDVRYLNYLIF